MINLPIWAKPASNSRENAHNNTIEPSLDANIARLRIDTCSKTIASKKLTMALTTSNKENLIIKILTKG